MRRCGEQAHQVDTLYGLEINGRVLGSDSPPAGGRLRHDANAGSTAAR